MTCATDLDNQATEPDEQQMLMRKFQELSAMEPPPSVTLTNIYKEIPISHPASICEVKSHQLELCTSELQLAAISQCKEVYIRSPYLETAVLGQLAGIDIRRCLVQLCNFSRSEIKEDNRRTVRVRFKRPLQIMLQSGADRISGVIHDISLGGCCLNTLVRKELAESEGIFVELKLVDPASGQLSCASIPSSLLRIDGSAPPYKCALNFNHTKQSEQFLSIFINQRQLEILKELREAL